LERSQGALSGDTIRSSIQPFSGERNAFSELKKTLTRVTGNAIL
jgi:hypothetical protein